MIARLEGVLIERMPPHVTIDCGGVGYDVVCSGYTLASLPADGERVTLRVFTHATENKIALFGFIDSHERALFDLLITVKNVGPTTAIAILTGSNPRDIATFRLLSISSASTFLIASDSCAIPDEALTSIRDRLLASIWRIIR